MKKFFALTLLIIGQQIVFSQNDELFTNQTGTDSVDVRKNNLLKNWHVGGDFSLTFGTVSYIEISPAFLYKFKDRLLLGPGVSYIYYGDKRYGYSTYMYGANVQATYFLTSGLSDHININLGEIVLHSKYEFLNADYEYIFTSRPGRREWANNLLVGGGIFQPIGRRAGVSLLLLFDVTQHIYSIYTNPIIKMQLLF